MNYNTLSKIENNRTKKHLNALGEPTPHITNGSGKMAGISNISVNCNCTECDKHCALKNECYAKTYIKMRKDLREWLDYNTALLQNSILKNSQLPQINARFMRFNGFGGLHNKTQVINYVNICNANPYTTFTLWTKNLKALKTAFSEVEKPKNLIIVYSSPALDIQVSIDRLHDTGYSFIDKVFTVYTYDYLINNPVIINCGGLSCMGCMRCYDPNNTEVYVNEILKKHAKKYYKHVLQATGFQCNSLSLEQMHNIYKMITK